MYHLSAELRPGPHLDLDIAHTRRDVPITLTSFSTRFTRRASVQNKPMSSAQLAGGKGGEKEEGKRGYKQ